MGKIRQLDETLSNMIAAGEVVENMASVVKELLENAIDASAKSVEVHLREAGFREITVLDDGEGMDKDDLRMAFKRHATSKIKTHHDLHHIGSLGFRGEALPSIASVAKVEVDASLNEQSGDRIVVRNGDIVSEEKGEARKGTKILIKDLFYNTPARLKHLKSAQRELSFVVDYVNKIALSHPHIAFTLTNNGKTLLKTQGDNDVLKVLHQIYPLDVIKNMLAFENKNQYFKIKGYMSKPSHTRSSRQHMTLITNRRIIHNNKLLNAALSAYRTYLPVHKFPILYLEVEVDPLLVDVNIHPQKLSVKFTEEAELRKLIESTLASRLKSEDLIPMVERREQPAPEQSGFDFTQAKERQSERPSKVEETPAPPPTPEKTQEEPASKKNKRLPYLSYIGQSFGTYLLFQDENALYIVDQHAAAERIRYEQYIAAMSRETPTVRNLLTPFDLSLSNREILAHESIKETLLSFGLHTEVKDDTTLSIHSHPHWFKEGEEEEYAERMVRLLLAEEEVSVSKMIDKVAADLACKHSVRANKYINKHEIDRLIEDLDRCENPFTCPHGRPTILSFSTHELETMFQRVQS